MRSNLNCSAWSALKFKLLSLECAQIQATQLGVRSNSSCSAWSALKLDPTKFGPFLNKANAWKISTVPLVKLFNFREREIQLSNFGFQMFGQQEQVLTQSQAKLGHEPMVMDKLGTPTTTGLEEEKQVLVPNVHNLFPMTSIGWCKIKWELLDKRLWSAWRYWNHKKLLLPS